MKKPPRVFIYPEVLLQGLLVAGSPHAWLIAHCLHGNCRPIATAGVIRRIHRVLHDPVFQLTDLDRNALYAEFLPRFEILTSEQFHDRVNIVVKPRVLIPGMAEDDAFALVPPWFYKSLVGLDEEDAEKGVLKRPL